ncbi:MAG: hypothetical protein ACJ742_20130, partial [Actinomycetes bacterium]
MVEQEGDRGVNIRSAHEVIVVQDQQTGGGQGGQVVDQAGDHDLRWGRPRGLKPRQHPTAAVGGHRLKSGD